MKKTISIVLVASLALVSCMKHPTTKTDKTDKVRLVYQFANPKAPLQSDVVDLLQINYTKSDRTLWTVNKRGITNLDTTFYVEHGRDLVINYEDVSVSGNVTVYVDDVVLTNLGFAVRNAYTTTLRITSGEDKLMYK